MFNEFLLCVIWPGSDNTVESSYAHTTVPAIVTLTFSWVRWTVKEAVHVKRNFQNSLGVYRMSTYP